MWKATRKSLSLSSWRQRQKKSEALNYDLFWGPKWAGNRASEANIQHTSKGSSNWHVNWWKISGIFLVLENDQGPEFLLV